MVAISSVVLVLSGCLAECFGLSNSDKVVFPRLKLPVHDLVNSDNMFDCAKARVISVRKH